MAVESVVAVAVADWRLSYVRPKPSCVARKGVCLKTRYHTPATFTQVTGTI